MVRLFLLRWIHSFWNQFSVSLSLLFFYNYKTLYSVFVYSRSYFRKDNGEWYSRVSFISLPRCVGSIWLSFSFPDVVSDSGQVSGDLTNDRVNRFTCVSATVLRRLSRILDRYRACFISIFGLIPWCVRDCFPFLVSDSGQVSFIFLVDSLVCSWLFSVGCLGFWTGCGRSVGLSTNISHWIRLPCVLFWTFACQSTFKSSLYFAIAYLLLTCLRQSTGVKSFGRRYWIPTKSRESFLLVSCSLFCLIVALLAFECWSHLFLLSILM